MPCLPDPRPLSELKTGRVQEPSEAPEDEADQVIQKLANVGVLTLPPGQSIIPLFPDSERLELAERLGHAPGKPLSEILIEERGLW